jgi:CubicO group peptidase (beta-lactamase class C family)
VGIYFLPTEFSNKMIRLLPFLLLTVFSSCTVWRFAVYNFADIKDHKKFPSRALKASTEPFKFHISEDPIDPTLRFTDSDPGTKLSKYLEKTKTVAFLIIRRDSILFEHYYSGYKKESIVPSFSVAKSFTSALIGCAIADGLIGSENEPIVKYLPELKDRNLDGVTIKHLLQMTSGIRFNESYFNPFGDAAKFYYGRNLRKYVSKMNPEKAPGVEWKYHSGNTQILGVILERVLKGKTVTQYLQEKIWTPIGMELNASWSIDKKENGMEKTFCCLNTTAHDYAKFGRLYLKNGNWNGKQVVPENWVKMSTKPDLSLGGKEWYQFQWWIDSPNGDYHAEGILGQFVYVNPASEVIIVRLGKSDGKVGWTRLMMMLAQGLKRN